VRRCSTQAGNLDLRFLAVAEGVDVQPLAAGAQTSVQALPQHLTKGRAQGRRCAGVAGTPIARRVMEELGPASQVVKAPPLSTEHGRRSGAVSYPLAGVKAVLAGGAELGRWAIRQDLSQNNSVMCGALGLPLIRHRHGRTALSWVLLNWVSFSRPIHACHGPTRGQRAVIQRNTLRFSICRTDEERARTEDRRSRQGAGNR